MNDDPNAVNIKVRKLHGKSKQYRIDIFVWESYNGIKPKGMSITHINNDEKDNRVSNQQAIKITKKKQLTDEERHRNDGACKARWKEKEYECPKCGKILKNNLRSYHRKICLFSDKPFTKEEKQYRKEIDYQWKHRQFKCPTSSSTYKNSYKSVHIRLCNRQEE